MLTIVNNGLNPYSKYPLIKEEDAIFEGTKYSLKTHCKPYSTIERIKKFAAALFLTLFTLGFLLIKESFRSEWGKVFYGTALKLVRIPSPTISIDQETLERAKKFVQENSELIKNRESDEHIHFYNGKHCTVFSHTAFPGLILKIMGTAQAEDSLKNLETAQTLVKDYSLDSCYIPQGKIIELDSESTLFVMEKAPGMTNPSNCALISENEYALFGTSPEIKEKWRTYFVQAAELIARLGYWDTDWRNILLDKDRGFSFIDFEKNSPSENHILGGIERLLQMAPAEFYPEIAAIAKQHGVDIDISKTQEEQRELHERNASIRKWHQEHSVNAESTVLNIQNLSPDFIEKAIIDMLDKQLNNEYFQKSTGENLVEKRHLSCQPLYQLKVERAEFDSALQRLKERNVLCTWTVREMFQKELACYDIYF